MWVILLLGNLLALLLYFLALKPHRYWKNKGVPYVKPLPFIGNVASNIFRKKAFAHLYEEWYQLYPDKRFVGFYHFLSPRLLLRDPELIKEVAVKAFDTFPDRKPFIPEDSDRMWSKNLAAIKGGEKWRDLRSTLSPSFTGNKMKIMFGLMQECAKQLSNHYQKQGGIVTIETNETFSRFAIDVIATTAFGINCNSYENKTNEFFMTGKKISTLGGVKSVRFFGYIVFPTLMKLLNIGLFPDKVIMFFKKIVTNVIKLREAEGIIRPDMIHLLMEARKGNLKHDVSDIGDAELEFAVVEESELGRTQIHRPILTDDDITAQAFFFFMAGFQTVEALMSFASYELAVNPDVQEKLKNEVDATLESCKGKLTYEALLQMNYLDMVMTETLRLWPGPPITTRVSDKPFMIKPKLKGEKPIVLDTGTVVVFPIYPIHRDPNYYPNPEKFDPERFNEENKQNIKPYTYLPFGAGPRNCIGSRYALLEGKLAITEIVSKFEIVPVKKTQIPLQLDKGNVIPRADKGIWLGLKPRLL